jgi:hypothetical protein
LVESYSDSTVTGEDWVWGERAPSISRTSNSVAHANNQREVCHTIYKKRNLGLIIHRKQETLRRAYEFLARGDVLQTQVERLVALSKALSDEF